jgi:hypothetical protein
MKKILLIVLSVFIMLIISAPQPVCAHDDGSMHVHIKGRVMSDKGGPIAGVQLDLNSVRGAIYPLIFCQGRKGRECIQCLSMSFRSSSTTRKLLEMQNSRNDYSY